MVGNKLAPPVDGIGTPTCDCAMRHLHVWRTKGELPLKPTEVQKLAKKVLKGLDGLCDGDSQHALDDLTEFIGILETRCEELEDEIARDRAEIEGTDLCEFE
jgi:hypothetical protein